jgi:8-oxo-dGTP pyrophosphatase MutT (NUDIX family)
MKHSCGAIFYTFDPNGKIGIILGQEQETNGYLPFKGCMEEGETLVQAAVREIFEETGGLVKLETIDLEHQFTSKRKHYHIGVCEVPYDIIEKYHLQLLNGLEKRKEFLEKRKLKFFDLDEISGNNDVHNISKSSVNYYMNKLRLIQIQRNTHTNSTNIPDNITDYCRKQSIPSSYLCDGVDINKVTSDINQLLQFNPENQGDNVIYGNIYGNKRKKRVYRKDTSVFKPKINLSNRYNQLPNPQHILLTKQESSIN